MVRMSTPRFDVIISPWIFQIHQGLSAPAAFIYRLTSRQCWLACSQTDGIRFAGRVLEGEEDMAVPHPVVKMSLAFALVIASAGLLVGQ